MNGPYVTHVFHQSLDVEGDVEHESADNHLHGDDPGLPPTYGREEYGVDYGGP